MGRERRSGRVRGRVRDTVRVRDRIGVNGRTEERWRRVGAWA